MDNILEAGKHFIEEKCDLRKFITQVKDKANHGWIFRGQGEASKGLNHTFERACDRFNILSSKRCQIEYEMIREFKRRLHHYESNTPDKEATDEWLALMQHYGAPTRLLDFTYSPYVAAYFAFEHAEKDKHVAIWAINSEWLINEDTINKIDPDKKFDIYKNYETYQHKREDNYEVFDRIFKRKTDRSKLVLVVNPFRLNERLAYQRGVFLCPGDISISFEENLLCYEDLKDHLIEYTIYTGKNNEHTIEALEYLDTMNISRITLFPGLDGFAQSFEPRIKSLFDIQSHRWD